MKKNAFTLVELLAVIILLGLLSTLAIPKLVSTLKDAKKNSYEISTEALYREATNYYLEKKASNSFQECTYNFDTNTNTCEGFEFKGTHPITGRMEIKTDGNVNIAVQFENYCYIVGTDYDLTVTDYDITTCGENSSIFTN